MTNIRINHIYSFKPTTDSDPYLPSHVVVVQKDNKRGYWLVKDVRDSSNDNLIYVHYIILCLFSLILIYVFRLFFFF